jgi:hypothetical protein
MRQNKEERLFKSKDLVNLASGTGPEYEAQFRRLHKLMTQKQELSNQLNYLKNELKLPINVIMDQFENDDSLNSITVGDFTISLKTIKYNGVAYLWAE